jgi:DNA polymerase III subunit epsilon
MKILFYDLETTGLKSELNAIHQMAGIIDYNGKVAECFNLNLKPFPGAIIEDKALEVAKVTRDQINAYPPENDGYRALIKTLGNYVDKFNTLDRLHLAGYNISHFDNQFLRALWNRQGDNYFGSWFWPDCLDVMVLASYRLRHERHKLANFQLRTVAAYLGIVIDQSRLHDALYDIELTRALFYKLQ